LISKEITSGSIVDVLALLDFLLPLLLLGFPHKEVSGGFHVSKCNEYRLKDSHPSLTHATSHTPVECETSINQRFSPSSQVFLPTTVPLRHLLGKVFHREFIYLAKEKVIFIATTIIH